MEEVVDRKLTRGKVLKRAGIGAAALWAAPLVASSSAYAGVDSKATKICKVYNPNTGVGGACGDACTVGVFYCESTGACGCGFSTQGCCTCIAIDSTFSCASQPCNSNSDCPAGLACLLAYCCNNGAKGICVTICPDPGKGSGSAKATGSVKLS
jgi:hypothetical protein